MDKNDEIDWESRAKQAEKILLMIHLSERVDFERIRQLYESNPEFCGSKWVLYSTKHTDKYPTLEVKLKLGEANPDG